MFAYIFVIIALVGGISALQCLNNGAFNTSVVFLVGSVVCLLIAGISGLTKG